MTNILFVARAAKSILPEWPESANHRPMQKAVFLPQLELSMENIAVTKWLVQPGERVRVDQPILQVETEKAVTDVSSSDSGYLRRQCVKEGVAIGRRALLCILTDSPDEPIEEDDRPVAPIVRTALDTDAGTAAHESSFGVPPSGGIRAAPAARKLARQLGIDLQQVKGSGPDGRITVDDVEAWREN